MADYPSAPVSRRRLPPLVAICLKAILVALVLLLARIFQGREATPVYMRF